MKHAKEKSGFRPMRTLSTGSPAALSRIAAVLAVLTASFFLLYPDAAQAAAEAETKFVLDSFAFLIWGALVMWMCAGFTMLESGSVRTKNASVICLKNIGLYSIAGLTFYFLGYNVMYVGVEEGGWIGTFSLFYGTSADEIALLGGDASKAEAVIGNGYAVMSDWFFQMVFVATAASIVSGALAERVQLVSFFVFIAILTAVVYPIVGAWTWGGGWLAAMGFQDFAGSTIVHSTGGWAALAGAVIVGPRRNKFRADGSARVTPPSNVPAVTLGVFILWLGWFGFNGGSQLALGSAADVVALANILANTNLSAAAGVLAALALARPLFGRIDLLAGLNGAIGGLVAITAGPDIVEHYWAVVIGLVGGAVTVAGLKVLEVLRIDDVVGAIPAHLFAGVWGTMAVCIAAGGNVLVQLTGVLAVGAFVFGSSLLIWAGLKYTMGAQGVRHGRATRPGRRRARHRGLSGIRADAGGGRRLTGRAASTGRRSPSAASVRPCRLRRGGRRRRGLRPLPQAPGRGCAEAGSSRAGFGRRAHLPQASGTPLPFSRSRAPELVIGAIRTVTGPSSVGARTLPPRTASASETGRSTRIVRPSRRNQAWGSTAISTSASPGGPPEAPGSPRPARRSRAPSSVAGGTLSAMLRPDFSVSRTVPPFTASRKGTVTR